MLQTSVNTSCAMLRQMMIIPVAACAMLLFSFSNRKDLGATLLKADKKIVIVVDAGHGGKDIGGEFKDLMEKDLNLHIANRLKILAPAHNIDVQLVRSTDEMISLPARVAFSNKVHPDDYISIHVNNDSDKGPENYMAIISKNYQAEKSKHLATAVLQQLSVPLSLGKNGLAVQSKGLYVLKNNDVPGFVIEMGDIKNKQQMERLGDDTKLNELCNAILNGVVAAHNK